MALVTGTANPDILSGTILDDTIQGLAADDFLYGFDGNDLLQGGAGDNILYGGSGDDILTGGAGEDLFYGQSGFDFVTYASALSGVTLNLVDPTQSASDAVGDIFLSVEGLVLSVSTTSTLEPPLAKWFLPGRDMTLCKVALGMISFLERVVVTRWKVGLALIAFLEEAGWTSRLCQQFGAHHHVGREHKHGDVRCDRRQLSRH